MARLLFALLLIASTVCFSQTHKALFDNSKNETAGNADWVIDNDQPLPSPAQSGITPATAQTYWTGAISAWGVDLVKLGFTVHTLTATYGITYGNSGNPYDLSHYDLFVVCEPQNPFTAPEKAAIKSFVQNGGGLMMVADHDGSDRNSDGWDSPKVWNDLRTDSLFGIHFQSTGESNNNISDTSTNVATGVDSIIHGAAGTVTAMSFHNGTTMRLLTGANPDAQGHLWMQGVARGTTQIMAATSRYGAGKVAGVGDSSPADDGSAQSGNSNIFNGWTEPGSTNNLVFLNMCLWLVTTSSPPPAQVQLLTPAQGSTSLAVPVTFRWLTSPTATAYQLDLSTSSTFVTLAYTDSSLSDTSSTVSALSLNTTYYWRVRAKNAFGWGAMSGSRNFVTWDVPQQVQLLLPANGGSGFSPPVSFAWRSAPGATGYRFELSLASTFSPPLVSDSSLTDTSTGVGGLSWNTTYYWHVGAKNGAGWGSYGSARSFATLAPPAAVQPLSPADASTGNTVPVVLRWSAGATATTYQVDLSLSSTFAQLLSSDSTLVDTATTIGGLDWNTPYYWRARAKNASGWGPFGPSRLFTTIAPPAAVQPHLPPNASTSNGVPTAFAWLSNSGAARYELTISTSSDFASLVVDDSSRVDTTAVVGGLDWSATYFWRVRAGNMAGWGPFGPARSFTTLAPPPPVQLVYPQDSSSGIAVPATFRWNPSPTATSYRFELSPAADFSVVTISDSTLLDTSRSVPNLPALTTFFWRVRGRNAAGWGTVSETRRFTTWSVPTQVTLLSPADSAVNPVAYSWSRTAATTNYQWECSRDSLFAVLITADSTIIDTSVAISAGIFPNEAIYYWRVRGRNGAGWGPFSRPRSFLVVHPPAPTLLISPSNGSFGVGSPTTLRWHSPASGAVRYQLQLGIDTGFASVAYSDSTLTDTSVRLSNLDSLTRYAWRVRAGNAAGWGAYSAPWEFTVSQVLSETTNIASGWNLLSIPLGLQGYRTGSLFPGARSMAFTYGGAYLQRDSVPPGMGFWIKYDTAQAIVLQGLPITEARIDLRKGWNLIGTLSSVIPVSSVHTEPPGILASPFFEYQSTYALSAFLRPFRGYWVKSTQVGTLILQAPLSR
jgi:hypothetical protein